MSSRLENALFDLKFTAKSFERAHKKALKDEKVQRKKVKQAIEKGNIDGARIYAQNAIRKKNEAQNYLRLASRVDAVASRLETAIKMNQVTKSMGQVVGSMNKVLKTMDVSQIAKVMDKFEQQFDNLDVTSAYMEQSMSESTALSTPEDEVNTLMNEVADEHGLEISSQLGIGTTVKTKMDPLTQQQDDLSARLAKLKSGTM